MMTVKKGLLKIPLLLAIFLSVISVAVTAQAAEKSNESNKYNVVFVMDASGSMNQTDPEENRFDAMDLFVGLLANKGNHVGTVAFGDGIVTEHDISEVKSFVEKKQLTEELKNAELENWTDIGSGLYRAEEMIRTGGNPDIPSIILLLTDGNTTMETQEKINESVSKKEDAIENARQGETKIYTICLNKNNAANSDELKQIAEATGGEFREVTEANDLQSVFDLYYQMIYSTTSIELANEKVSGSGVLSKDFKVADVGVEEVNVIVFGDISKCTLTKPDGSALSEAEMNDITYSGKSFRLLKMQEPVSGNWNLSIEASPGSDMRIFKVYNPNLSVRLHPKESKDTYGVGNDIELIAELSEGGNPVTGAARLGEYKATLSVKDYEGKEIYTETKDQAGDDGFSFTFTPKDLGTYYAEVLAESDEISATSESVSMDVGNTPPVLNEEIVKKHINRWPFLIKTDKTVDLSEIATDAEDKTLTYRIRSSTWPEGDYTLDGDKLTIDKFSVSKGSFEVDAVDSMGAYVTSNVRITSTNVGLWAAILILAAIIGGGIAAAVIFYKKLSKKFRGDIFIENISSGAKDSYEYKKGDKGILDLSHFKIGDTGLKGHFQATDGKKIYFISKKDFYSRERTGSKYKKIAINHGEEIRISSNSDYSTGIKVKFLSRRG